MALSVMMKICARQHNWFICAVDIGRARACALAQERSMGDSFGHCCRRRICRHDVMMAIMSSPIESVYLELAVWATLDACIFMQ